ncbi:class I SAM-dependent methyltransferase [Streptomyces sp. NPDC048568]|uniref:class I SAM-dependent methyltransferase n=1 Tax=Streptomyces sp. NPDC048568 TaxID=3365571 RepID=UPI00371E788F
MDHHPALIIAVDTSPAQHTMAEDLYGHPASRLRLVRSGVLRHLHATAGTYDVLYSVFGAVDFVEPRELLPATAAALRPGGRLVFSAFAHHLGGEPAHLDVQHTEIGAKTPEGGAATMHRWSSRNRCGPRSSTRPALPGSARRRCPSGPGRAPLAHSW